MPPVPPGVMQVKAVGVFVGVMIAIPLVIAFAIIAGPAACNGVRNAVHPFPRSCDVNGEIAASGNWQGTTPILSDVGGNCKVHITNSKLKASALFVNPPDNLELWIENSTIETTETMMKPGVNMKLHIKNSTLTSQGVVVDKADNLTADITGSTLESVAGTAIKTGYNFKPQLDNSKIRGKNVAIDADANMELALKNASEVTSADGVAIKATSHLHVTSEGGKIDGGGGAIVAGDNPVFTGNNLTINSAKDKAIVTKSNLHVELSDSTITSATDDAIDAEQNTALTLENTTISGAGALHVKSNLKIKATKKSRLVGTTRTAIQYDSSADLAFSDSSVDGAQSAIKTTGNLTLTLQSGATISGKQGGVFSGYGFALDGQNAAISGGTGPGLYLSSGAQIAFKQSTLSGNPAISYEHKIDALDLTGTTVTGAQTNRTAQFQ